MMRISINEIARRGISKSTSPFLTFPLRKKKLHSNIPASRHHNAGSNNSAIYNYIEKMFPKKLEHWYLRSKKGLHHCPKVCFLCKWLIQVTKCFQVSCYMITCKQSNYEQPNILLVFFFLWRMSMLVVIENINFQAWTKIWGLFRFCLFLF